MIGGDVDEAGRRVGVTVVDMGEVGDLVESGKGEKEGLLREEIFGPILPVVGVDVSEPFPNYGGQDDRLTGTSR